MAQIANALTRPPRPLRGLSRARRLWRSASSHRLATQTTDLAATASDLTQTFAYNPASQIASVTRSNDLAVYPEQRRRRRRRAWTGHFNQNDPSTPNGLNQIGNAGAKTITHDTKGNITAVGSDTYGYASENFLTSGPASAALSYDPMGRLVQVAQGAATTRLGYDGLDRIAEYDAANAVLRRYIHGPGVDNPITWYEGSGTTTRKFLTADERGSIIAVSDSAGAVLGINKYDEFGNPQSTNPSTSSGEPFGKFGYTGQAWVPEVGLWYYKARFYRPDIGRFMQTDPIGYEAGTNLYAYVGNDPVNWTDPLGLSCGPNEVSGGYFGGYVIHTFGPDGKLTGVIIDGGIQKCYKLPNLDGGEGGREGGGGDRGGPGRSGGRSTPEEVRRGNCNNFQRDAAATRATRAAANVVAVAEVVSAGADAFAAVAVFVPGGQGAALFAKVISVGSQGVELAANTYVGSQTNNWSAVKSQLTGLGAGLVLGQAAGRVVRAGGIPGRMGSAARNSRTGAFGDAAGNVLGDAAANQYCGR